MIYKSNFFKIKWFFDIFGFRVWDVLEHPRSFTLLWLDTKPNPNHILLDSWFHESLWFFSFLLQFIFTWYPYLLWIIRDNLSYCGIFEHFGIILGREKLQYFAIDSAKLECVIGLVRFLSKFDVMRAPEMASIFGIWGL